MQFIPRPTSSAEQPLLLPQTLPPLRSAWEDARSAREVPTETSWCHSFADSANSAELNPTHQNSLGHTGPVVAAAASRCHCTDSAAVAVG